VGAVPKKARKKLFDSTSRNPLPDHKKGTIYNYQRLCPYMRWARTPCMPRNKGTLLNVPE
jgi:hypothetical protein